MEKNEQSSAIHSVDGKPLRPGDRVYLVTKPELNSYVVKPAKAVLGRVLRVSDGDKRSVLIRRFDGSETRWYPDEHGVASEPVFVSLTEAKREAGVRNDVEDERYQEEIEAKYRRLQKFKKLRRVP